MSNAPVWRPIETAPMDGTRVLTFRAGFAESMAVAWAGTDEEWRPVHGGSWPEPTHWMPLPDAPDTTDWRGILRGGAMSARRIVNLWRDTLPSCTSDLCNSGRSRCPTPDACRLAGDQIDEHEADRIEQPGLMARLLDWLMRPSPFETELKQRVRRARGE